MAHLESEKGLGGPFYSGVDRTEQGAAEPSRGQCISTVVLFLSLLNSEGAVLFHRRVNVSMRGAHFFPGICSLVSVALYQVNI